MTRRILEIIFHYRFPLHVITKSDLVTRDFDLLHQINEQAILPDDLRERLKHKVFITFSFSTLDNAIGRQFEPGATPPGKRLQTLRETSQVSKIHTAKRSLWLLNRNIRLSISVIKFAK